MSPLRTSWPRSCAVPLTVLAASALLAASVVVSPAPSAAASASDAGVPIPPDGESSYVEQDLAVNGEGGFPNYRIPAITVAPNGDLLASYDGRPTAIDAPGPNSILQRRSTDGGLTWGPQTVVAAGQTEAPVKGYSDPSYIVDRETGTIFNFHVYSQKQGFIGSRPGTDPEDPNVLHANISTSTDGGHTWTERTITADITPDPGWRSRFAASGQGIQLRYGPHAGRLVQQFTIINGTGAFQAVSVYSDDHGKTWRAGEAVGVGMDENKTVELSDGRVLLNSRDSQRGGYRKVAVSTDGGHSYGPVTQDLELPDPTNNAAIVRAFPNAPQGSARAKVLLFSNANSQSSRSNGTIRVSCDDGRSWPTAKTFAPGSTSYSTLTPLPDGSIGLLYEPGTGIRFAKLTLGWLEGVCAPLSASDVDVAAGSTVTVPMTVENQTGYAIPKSHVMVEAPKGWTSPDAAVGSLQPGATAEVAAAVTVPEDVVPGTYSVTARFVTPQGTSTTRFRVTVGLLDQAAMRVVDVDSEETTGEDGRAANILDGNLGTIWHTAWSTSPAPGYPHHVTVDLGATHEVSGLQYTRRQSGTNGLVGQYQVYVSGDGSTWGLPVATGSFTSAVAPQRATFAEVRARYVKLVALSALNPSHPWAAMAELNVEGTR